MASCLGYRAISLVRNHAIEINHRSRLSPFKSFRKLQFFGRRPLELRCCTTSSHNKGTVNNKDDGTWISKENRTLPNLITLTRILASPGLTYAVANDMKGVALAGCAFFGFSDWLDGYIARKYNQKSILGSFLDPLADKIMIGALSFGLMQHELLPTQLVALILGRDVFLLSMSIIIRSIDKPADAPFFEANQTTSTFEIVPSEMSKVR